jgi:hypothetical protein
MVFAFASRPIAKRASARTMRWSPLFMIQPRLKAALLEGVLKCCDSTPRTAAIGKSVAPTAVSVVAVEPMPTPAGQ